MSLKRTYRIGIDVGGTFTKAVVLDNATLAIINRASVLTTHDDDRGVAAGVVDVFRRVLALSKISPDSVVFIAHSTTQATNALLEGDVAKVGVLGLASQVAAKLAEPQVTIAPIELAPGCMLETSNRFLVTDAAQDDALRQAIAEMVAENAQVLVASAAFGVDNAGSEERVRSIAHTFGLPTTCGHEITKLYGLSVRTRTAVINASILPKMIATAAMTEASIREAGITAPLMIMRGDGGAMLIDEMYKRPAVTMLSGPAASVAGSLMHLKVSDGIYFEVGGTSTNIAVIQSGRPSVTYARVGGHDTYVSSLDVRVLGVAGGSLIRIRDGRIRDVGPRSAHIAGLAYAAFATPEEIERPVLDVFEPKPGDGCDYAMIRTGGAGSPVQNFALTTTCAANALGLVPTTAHSCGNRAAARAAFAPLAAYLGTDIDSAAREVLQQATDKLVPVIEGLVADYGIDLDQRLLIAVGGGAGTLGPYLADRMAIRCEIAPDAEVISSIGAATAMVREVVERILPSLKPEDLMALREEAIAAAVRAGAERQSIDVALDVDKTTGRARAIAIGAAEMQTGLDGGRIVESLARSMAARSLSLSPTQVHLAAETTGARVYLANSETGAGIRIVDSMGKLRLQRSRGLARSVRAADAIPAIEALWDAAIKSTQHLDGSRGGHSPGLVLLYGDHIVDLSGVADVGQMIAVARSELARVAADETIALVALPKA
jgi:N-methylhydantoinase A